MERDGNRVSRRSEILIQVGSDVSGYHFNFFLFSGRNPEPRDDLAEAFNNTVRPDNWAMRVEELDVTDINNNGYQNEHFIVWMRNAPLPNFRRMYARISHGDEKKFR